MRKRLCAAILTAFSTLLPGQQRAPDDATELASAIGRFGARVLEHLDPTGNACLSPTSSALCLLMAYAGAGGETAAEMARALAPEGWTSERIHRAAAALRSRLLHEDEGFTLATAQDFWGQHGYTLKRGFLDTLRTGYEAKPHVVDFRADHEAARRQINAHIAKLTQGRIDSLLRPGTLNKDTRLVLTDTLYLKATWQFEFDPEDTFDSRFKQRDGSWLPTKMMRVEATFSAASDDRQEVVRFLYRGGEFALDVAMPRDMQNLAKTRNELLTTSEDRWNGFLRQEKLIVLLPRFRIRMHESLRKPIEMAGIRRAFRPDADFTAAMDDPQGLRISDVVQQTFFDVGEKGTEAAAATATVMAVGAAIEEDRPRIVVFNQPFAFALRDLRTNLVLFAGQCTEPVKTSAASK